MIYGAYIDTDGERQAALYDTFADYYRDTFSPETEEKALIEFKITGKTYSARKDSARELAKKFQTIDAEMSGGLSWGEYMLIGSYFEEIGRRFGLLSEFRENCIIGG